MPPQAGAQSFVFCSFSLIWSDVDNDMVTTGKCFCLYTWSVLTTAGIHQRVAPATRTMTAAVNTTGGDDDDNGGSGSGGHTHVLVYLINLESLDALV